MYVYRNWRKRDLKFYTFASGSKGNSYFVKTESGNMLLDCGIAGKHIISGMETLGESFCNLDGIFLTHEHTDHVKSIRMISKKAENAGVYASRGTLGCVGDKVKEGKKRIVAAGDRVEIGKTEVNVFSLSHDAAEPTGYSFAENGKRVTVITDTGIIHDGMKEIIEDTDLFVLEANHEKNILMMGAYPYYLKQRITGKEGHLSNEDAGICIAEMLSGRKKKNTPLICLAHLSGENNTSEQARLTVRNTLMEQGFNEGTDYGLRVFDRGQPGPLIEF